jgi:hypothetical protein
MHLFDEGKKSSSRAAYERDQQDNRNALHWAVEQINQIIARGQTIDFVVFTGDFGLELVRRSGTESLCLDKDDAERKNFDKYKTNGWPDFISIGDAANAVAREFSRLQVRTIFVLPGNNDFVGEDPCDISRYTDFVQALSGAMSGGRQIVDLASPGPFPLIKGFRLIGLNTAFFKPPSDKEEQTEYGKKKRERKRLYASGQIHALDAEIHSTPSTPSLLFTHIPDLVDPFTNNSSWDIKDADRNSWTEIASSPSITAIFAGHFHSADRLLYARPGQDIRYPRDQVVSDKTWVAPPLAIKFQDDKPETARGFLLVRVQNSPTASVSVTPFWYAMPQSAQTMCWRSILSILSVVAALAILIWGIVAFADARYKYPRYVREAYPTFLTLIGLSIITFGIWLVMRFMTSDLGLDRMYYAGPIFGAIGGVFAGLGDRESFALASYEGPSKFNPGILGAVISGMGGAIAVIFVTERALKLEAGNSDSLLWLMSISFVAGVAGRNLVQTAIEKVLKQEQETKRELSGVQQRLTTLENARAQKPEGASAGADAASHNPTGAPTPPRP